MPSNSNIKGEGKGATKDKIMTITELPNLWSPQPKHGLKIN